MSCDLSCQSNLFASCTSTVTGGCTAQCSQPMGALFCNGQYVNVGNNVQSCINQLQSALNINVTVMGNAMCSGNQCSASASASCDVGNQQAPLPGGIVLLGLGALGASVIRRRRVQG
jgi:MYXO-CTERM domain-containing protein